MTSAPAKPDTGRNDELRSIMPRLLPRRLGSARRRLFWFLLPSSTDALTFSRYRRGGFPTPALTDIRHRPVHAVGGLDDFGIHLVGALRLDQLGDFLHGIDVGRFQIALEDGAEALVRRD